MMWTVFTSPSDAVNFDCILHFIQSLLAQLGLDQYGHSASLWLFFAACGVAELMISFLICTLLERFWPLTNWPERNSIAANVTYAFFVRIVLFPLIAYFEFAWLRQHLDEFLRVHSIALPSLDDCFFESSWRRILNEDLRPHEFGRRSSFHRS